MSRHYRASASGIPEMSTLELLRYRRFVSVQDAAEGIGVSSKVFRCWETGHRQPIPDNRLKLEALFGRPWRALQRPANRLNIPIPERGKP